MCSENPEESQTETHEFYLDAKLKFEQAKAKLKFEKKRQREESQDRQLEKKLKQELAEVKARVKKETACQKTTHQYVKELEINSDSDSDEPCESICIQTGAQQHNVVEKWQRGHQKAALKAAQDETVLAATVLTLRHGDSWMGRDEQHDILISS